MMVEITGDFKWYDVLNNVMITHEYANSNCPRGTAVNGHRNSMSAWDWLAMRAWCGRRNATASNGRSLTCSHSGAHSSAFREASTTSRCSTHAWVVAKAGYNFCHFYLLTYRSPTPLHLGYSSLNLFIFIYYYCVTLLLCSQILTA